LVSQPTVAVRRRILIAFLPRRDVIALDCGQDLNAEQVGSPRCFKSHEAYDGIAKGGRYVYVARDPRDAFLSFFHFLPAYMGLEAGDVSMDFFADSIFAGVSHSGLIWNHFLSWWRVRGQENVLWVFFEDLREDLRGNVAKIAEFMGVGADDALLELASKQSSFEFMSANASAFDSHFDFDAVKRRMGMAADAKFTVGKVRKGGGVVGGHKEGIPPHILARLDECWDKILADETGAASYAELRAAYHKEQEQEQEHANTN